MKTITNRQHLPSWDAADSAIGVDSGNGEQIYIRAGQNFRTYINTLPNATSWLTDLSAGREAFQIPQQHWNQTDTWYSDAGTTPTVHINGGTGQVQANGGLSACNTGAAHCATFVFNPNLASSVSLSSPLQSGTLGLSINIPNGTPTFAVGTGVTSVACASGYTCTNQRGELTIVGGTATTGTIATVTFSQNLTTAPGMCLIVQNGGSSNFSLESRHDLRHALYGRGWSKRSILHGHA